MGSLAENVMNGAQEAQNANPIGHSVGDAIQAYQMQQDAQMKRQELEMKKDENERNKANWLNSQIVAIGRQPEGAARDLMMKGFERQLPSVVPGANTDITELFKKDPETLRKATEAAQHYMNNGQFDPSALNQFFTMTTPDAIDAINKNAENVAKIKAQQLGGQAAKAQNQQDAQVTGLLSKFDAPGTQLSKLIGLGNKLDNDSTLLNTNDPKHPVTYQAVHEVITNIATVLGNGTVSDSRTNSITPQVSGETAARIATLATNNPNRPADPEVIKFAQNMVSRLNSNVGHQVNAAADQIGSSRTNPALFHNPVLAQAANEKMKYYKQGQWRMSVAGAAPDQAAAPLAPAAPSVEPQGAPSHYDHMSTPDLLKAWTDMKNKQAQGPQ